MKTKKKRLRRFSAMVVTLIMMICALLPGTAFAAGGTYDGTYYNELSVNSGTYYVGQKAAALATVTSGSKVPYIDSATYTLSDNKTELGFDGTYLGRGYAIPNGTSYTWSTTNPSGIYGVGFKDMTVTKPGTIDLVVTFRFRWSSIESWKNACIVYHLNFVNAEDTKTESLELPVGSSEDVSSNAIFDNKNLTDLSVVSSVSNEPAIASVTVPTVNGNNVDYTITGKSEGTTTVTTVYTGTTTVGPNLFGDYSNIDVTLTDIINVTVTDSRNKYQVTYTDGVADEEVFADQTYTVKEDETTPTFEGTPEREGYTFTGWTPAVAEFVTEDATYVATWKEDTSTDPDPETQAVTLKYIDESDNTIKEVTVAVAADVTSVDAATVTENMPEGYTFVSSDYQITDGVVTIIVKQDETEPDPGTDPSEPSSGKVSEPDMDKVITSDDNIQVDDNGNASANAGDTISFELNSTIPESLVDYIEYEFNASSDKAVGSVKEGETYDLVFHDVMSDSLTMTDDGITVSIDGVALDSSYYTFTPATEEEPLEDGCTFEVSIDLLPLYTAGLITDADLGAAKITVAYSAVLSEDAGAGASTNKAYVTYPDGEQSSEEDIVEVYTYGVSIYKYDKETESALAGATFTLYDADNTEVGSAVTGDDGTATIEGIAAGTYYLVETAAPTGYVASKDAVEISIPDAIVGDTYMASANIANAAIPSTGGAGTMMYTIFGMMIIVAAGTMLVVTRKKREE